MILGIFESMKFTINILVVIFSFAAIFGQNSQRDYSEELRYQNEAINALKDEIQNLREKIKKTESGHRHLQTALFLNLLLLTSREFQNILH